MQKEKKRDAWPMMKKMNVCKGCWTDATGALIRKKMRKGIVDKSLRNWDWLCVIEVGDCLCAWCSSMLFDDFLWSAKTYSYSPIL